MNGVWPVKEISELDDFEKRKEKRPAALASNIFYFPSAFFFKCMGKVFYCYVPPFRHEPVKQVSQNGTDCLYNAQGNGTGCEDNTINT
jgi:hypothetical protein